MTARKTSHRFSRGRSLSRNVPKDIKIILKRLTSGRLTVILVLTIPLISVLLNARIEPVAKCTRRRGAMNVADRPWPAWVAAAAALLVSGFAIQAQTPPPALPADAAAHQFAAGRAHKHVEAIAQRPHPMGSPESQRVREDFVRATRKRSVSRLRSNLPRTPIRLCRKMCSLGFAVRGPREKRR